MPLSSPLQIKQDTEKLNLAIQQNENYCQQLDAIKLDLIQFPNAVINGTVAIIDATRAKLTYLNSEAALHLSSEDKANHIQNDLSAITSAKQDFTHMITPLLGNMDFSQGPESAAMFKVAQDTALQKIIQLTTSENIENVMLQTNQSIEMTKAVVSSAVIENYLKHLSSIVDRTEGSINVIKDLSKYDGMNDQLNKVLEKLTEYEKSDIPKELKDQVQEYQSKYQGFSDKLGSKHSEIVQHQEQLASASSLEAAQTSEPAPPSTHRPGM
jgi:hypothetical protein